MAGHTAAHCKDALCHGHTTEVFRRCFDTDKDNFLFLFSPCLCIIGKENNLAAGCARRCGETLGNDEGALEGGFVEYRVEQLVEFLRLHAKESGLFVDFACTEQIHGDFHHGSAGALAVTCLEHPEFAVLDGELHVLHVLIVVFELVGDCNKLGCTCGHRFLERGIFCGAVFFGDALEGCPAA